MAGAGYKLFNTGDVLTAAQVNTYLMEQTVMVFADAAARTTALTGVVSEGMISYLKDTNAVEVYNGSAWVASDDPNAIQNTIVDAKGDLITATAADTPARLAVGSNGDTLVADSAASTGLRWQGSQAAGRNVIINGNFDIWQRGTSFTSVASGTYCADRFSFGSAGTGVNATVARDTSVPNAQSQYSLKVTQASGTATSLTAYQIRQGVEIGQVETFAGKTVTLSFWYRSNKTGSHGWRILGDNATGSADSSGTFTVSVADTWEKKTVTTATPFGSITAWTGAQTAAGLYLDLGFRTSGGGFSSISASDYFQVAQVQIEAGNVATNFQTATGTLQGELAACQRYYYRVTADGAYSNFGFGSNSADNFYPQINFPVTMRIAPSSLDASAAANFEAYNGAGGVTSFTSLTLATAGTTKNLAQINVLKSGGFVSGRNYSLGSNNSTSTYLGFSAEL